MSHLSATGARTRLAIPQGFGLKAFVLVLLVVLVVAPLAKVFGDTLTPAASGVWADVLASNLSRNLFWLPLVNTLVIGVSVAAGCVVVGGFLAWLVVMTDVPFRRTIALMSTPTSSRRHR
jgi:iron(III) transport system permease protein